MFTLRADREIAPKVLLMGGAEAGKTSIKNVVFTGANPETLQTKPTVQYQTDLKELANTRFTIWDTGGQKSYLDDFMGPKGKRMFSNVLALVWVVDVFAEDELSRSKFYFDLALDNLRKFSPDSKTYCFFHKSDLRKDFDYDNLKIFFENVRFPDSRFHVTSIYDKSVFIAVADVLSNAVVTSSTKSLEGRLEGFVDDEITGVSIFTDEGLPLFEKGDMQNVVMVSANLWLGVADRIVAEFGTSDSMKAQIILSENYIFVFIHLEKSLLLGTVAKSTTPIQYVITRTEELASTLNEAIISGDGFSRVPDLNPVG